MRWCFRCLQLLNSVDTPVYWAPNPEPSSASVVPGAVGGTVTVVVVLVVVAAVVVRLRRGRWGRPRALPNRSETGSSVGALTSYSTLKHNKPRPSSSRVRAA